jgi:hypothetical protein
MNKKHYNKIFNERNGFVMLDKYDNTPMGYMYISESTNECSNVRGIASNRTPDIFYITFDTNLQDFDIENRNKRYYDASNIWECIQSEKIQSLLKTGGWFGEWSHPATTNADDKLSPERIQDVPPKYRAFKIMNPKLVGNVLTAKIQSAQGEIGESFAKEVLAGWIPQFSLRAIAHMVSRHGKPYVIAKRVITYDAPWYPSHAVAHMTSTPEVHTKSFTESVHTALESAVDYINGVMIPLSEILEDVGRTDVNVNMIMEAFDLDLNNLAGFDTKKEHVIIKDEDNVIYANINPATVKRINDFYTSF